MMNYFLNYFPGGEGGRCQVKANNKSSVLELQEDKSGKVELSRDMDSLSHHTSHLARNSSDLNTITAHSGK